MKYNELTQEAKENAYNYAVGLNKTEWAKMCEEENLIFNENGEQLDICGDVVDLSEMLSI